MAPGLGEESAVAGLRPAKGALFKGRAGRTVRSEAAAEPSQPSPVRAAQCGPFRR